MTRIYSGNVEIEVSEIRVCEGCGTPSEELFEDDAMNQLCAECANLSDDPEDEEDELPEGWNGDGR